MANVNCYPPNNVIKSDQPVNSQYIQKILDENVGLIHAIIEKQQQSQEAEDLLKSLHKNLIYLATIADQTTSAGNSANAAPPQQHPYNYPQTTIAHPVIANQNFPPNMHVQPMPYVTQPSMVPQSAPVEIVEKKPQPCVDESYKEVIVKSESSNTINVDIDRDMDKCNPIRDNSQQMAPHKSVDMDKDCPISQNIDVTKDMNITQNNNNNPEYIQKFEDNTCTVSSHIQNSNIKTDMPPPSQPIGIHQEKNPMQYPGNQRIMYPGVAPNYNQYSPHFDQNNKFYPQNMYQQSPYNNYQGIYNPYQPVAPTAAPTHYNQHMMNSPMYQQYPYYQQQQQQPGMDQIPPVNKESSMPQQMHPNNNPMSQPMYPPNTMPQSMYPTQNPMPQQMHPPNPMPPQSIKSESLPPSNSSNIIE